MTLTFFVVYEACKKMMQKFAILPLFGDLLTPDDLNFLQNPHKMGLDLKKNVLQTIKAVKAYFCVYFYKNGSKLGNKYPKKAVEKNRSAPLPPR